MKLKMIAVACATLAAGSAFAVTTPATVCDQTTLAGLLNKCAPGTTFYVGGASAQAPALIAVMATGGNGIFDTTKPFGRIGLMTSSISGFNGTVGTDLTKSNTQGWIGVGATGPSAGKTVLVIYNKANGSAAGVGQLLGNIKTAPEATTLVTYTTAQVKTGVAGTGCTVVTDYTAGTLGTATCNTETLFANAWGVDKAKVMHLALSDVKPSELAPGGLVKTGTTKALAWKASAFPNTVTGMQGFGVIVNPSLYTALINAQVATGQLPASCATSEVVGGATDTVTLACQPSIARATYTGLANGTISTAAGLTGVTGDTTAINLARRVTSSGTQAASNIFFLGQAGYVAKTPTTDLFLDPIALGTNGSVTVTEGAGTGDVITAVSGNTAGYAIGVVSLENYYSTTKSSSKLKGALFVKIDGFSPNMTDAGVDAKHRAALQAGYPFAFEMQAITDTKLADPYLDIANKIKSALVDPAQNLAGIAYIGSADATKNTAYTHAGNNYLPLSK
jgi:hypothetical protein